MNNVNETKIENKRDSGIELLRIITMLVIVAHHYVVNSGLSELIRTDNSISVNSVFLLLFGWGGKIGINCFVLITGYFMCKKNITVKKFLKLFLEVEFYNILIYFIFLLSGYEPFSIKGLIKEFLPIYSIGNGFIDSYLAFFFFIPFLNILIHGMNEKQHLSFIGLSLFIYTVLPTFLMANVTLNYVGWFMVIYLIAAYIRIYPKDYFDNKRLWGICAFIALIISWISVLLPVFIHRYAYYFFVNDSNKFLAVVTAICAFMFFKNLNLRYNKIINTVAASSFGVLLIHAVSDTMRRWLWKDVLDNIGFYNSNLLIIHALSSVIIIYIVCTVIDIIRIRFLEKPFFKWYDKITKKEGIHK